MTSDVIRFIHNDKIIEIKDSDPNETVLNYVREKYKKTGTKEGCAEGGCGACTIVVGTLNKNNIDYEAINSCIAFLPMINGKQLILVEDLAKDSKSLHPVQEAMYNFHGSQCGFCTPGFVMSLFAMFKNNYIYDDETIKDSISGNLCRCTGYNPIIKAAKSLNGKNKIDKFFKNKNLTINLLKRINNDNYNIDNNKRKFFSPKNISDLKKILKQYPNSDILNGGTDLSLRVTKERNNLNSIIYLGSIKELKYIKQNERFIEVGASTPLIKFEGIVKKFYPDFYKILKRYGSVQIRNVATISGNIATASPIGDTLPILLSLNANIVISDHKGNKIMPLNGFFINYRKTILKKGQFIKSVQIPFSKNNIFKAYKVSKRIDDDISSICGSFNINIKKNIIKEIFIAYGGMSATPKRALNCEKALLNNDFSKESFILAQKSLEKDFSPIDDVRASANYRKEIAKNLLLKCFLEIKNNKKIEING